jgi:hypothetical protein
MIRWIVYNDRTYTGSSQRPHSDIIDANGLPKFGHAFDEMHRGHARIDDRDKTVSIYGARSENRQAVISHFELEFPNYMVVCY